jgi:hypothetical protein
MTLKVLEAGSAASVRGFAGTDRAGDPRVLRTAPASGAS